MSYKLTERLNAHHGAINCLAFNSRGNFLCSAADDQRAIIWSIPNKRKFQEFHEQDWGSIKCVQWIGDSCDRETLGIGCESGVVRVYQQRDFGPPDGKFSLLCSVTLPEGGVESMAFDAYQSRLAIAGEFGDISLHQILKEGSPKQLWSTTIPAPPDESGRLICDLLLCQENSTWEVFCRHTGVVYSLDRDTGVTEEGTERHTNSKIAHVSLTSDHRCCLADNDLSSSGFSLYEFPSMRLLRSFSVRETCLNAPVFAENCDLVVAGSDHGKVYVFQAGNGWRKEILTHGLLAVQSVATFAYSDHQVIVSGTTDICFFERYQCTPVRQFLDTAHSLALVLAICLIFYQAILH
ncbi:WD40 repeat-like protein [Sistotremastrum niveocremeum HHB9708]|uniref:WD40 repeat-like protein n=1 Tax=Sistotremastrum niveocremeum HHB9708 TaxID=1314777 RepID=A0A164VMF2_9AGAM|nr:WD40 repeat-like protein [Sistotremastrum niveocremeum HHB9708]